ncbi:hypothetical protein CXB51_007700 [Gossypium anomalum]|uniref:Protein SIEVE ELEMENT OCCLUSION B-like n=1 Tax=Gossypium anomalum TaxID=47600 RepID=A0A8J5ZHF0_9ROSI|nr:hypothetical protein CXB51_007700 [Gossypium anomalum]
MTNSTLPIASSHHYINPTILGKHITHQTSKNSNIFIYSTMARPTPVPPSSRTSHPPMRNEFWMLDNEKNKQILSTHVPEDGVVNVKSFLRVIGNVLRHIIPNINIDMKGGSGHIDAFHDQTNLSADDGALDALHKICCELSCKCSGGGDGHRATMGILNMLSSYSWDAKVVLTFAAFAANFGELNLIAQFYSSSSLAKSVALLKQPNILEQSQPLKPHFDALNKLIIAMVDVTKCIVKLSKLPSKYVLSLNHHCRPPRLISTLLPTGSFRVSSFVLGKFQATSTKLTSETLELSYLTHKGSCIHEYLHSQLRRCEELKKEKKLTEAFEDFKRTVDTPQVDNLKILRDIFCKEQNLLNPDKTEVYINVLRRKYVLLLISNLDISQEEIRVLELVYKERVSSGHNYEILWLPIVDRIPRNDDYLEKFSNKKLIMPWYTLTHQFSIKPAVIKYIREVWGFVKKPIAVTLNPQGKVLSTNALNMMWIWRNSAFPFSNGKEEGLWKDKPSTLEHLVHCLEPNLPTWVSQKKVACFYGGVKMEWIESFTTTTKEVAKALEIGLEMVYVGKKNARERVEKITGLIKEKKLSHAWQDDNMWFFWNLLQNMWDTKVQQGKTNATDGITLELKTILGFDDSKKGWAVFYRSGEMVKANGEKVLESMKSSDQWVKSAKQMGFIPALREHLEGIIVPHHCTRLILPGNDDRIPEKVQCAECGRPMELHFLYRCCDK